MEWISINDRLPDDNGEYVKVRDENGIEAFAIPAWTPFEEKRNPLHPKNPRMNIIIPCEPRFDGWLIDVTDDFCKKIGSITHWKELQLKE